MSRSQGSSGQSLFEYALMVTLVALLVVAALILLRHQFGEVVRDFLLTIVR